MKNSIKQPMVLLSGNRIIVRPDTPPDQTTEGLFIPEEMRGAVPQTGTVVQIGNGIQEMEGLFVGAKVLYNDNRVNAFNLCSSNDEEKTLHYILDIEQIFGIL
jgi:co-chaperonin GroES (HSP10)